MKFDIIRQQVFTSLVTLFVMSLAGVFVLLVGVHSSLELVANESLLGGYIIDFQHSHVAWSAIISSAMIFISAVKLGRVVSTQNLFEVSTSIQLPLIGVMMWCVTLGADFLLSATVVTLSATIVREFLLAMRNTNYLPNLFNAALALSLLPLIYTPAAMMWIIVPFILLWVGVTLREWIVGVVGLLLPVAIVSYIFWLCGAELLLPVESMAAMFVEWSTLADISGIMLFRSLIIAVALLLTLLSMVWVKNALYKNRRRMHITLITILFALSTLVTPSATLLSFALLAPPLAITTAYAAVNLRGTVANILYFTFLALLVLSMFTPLYLPLL